jgi:hypothetical protein
MIDPDDLKIQDIYAAPVRDKDRNEWIFDNLLKALEMASSVFVRFYT